MKIKDVWKAPEWCRHYTTGAVDFTLCDGAVLSVAIYGTEYTPTPSAIAEAAEVAGYDTEEPDGLEPLQALLSMAHATGCDGCRCAADCSYYLDYLDAFRDVRKPHR